MEQVETIHLGGGEAEPHLVPEGRHLRQRHHHLAPVHDALVHDQAGGLARLRVQDEPADGPHSLAAPVDDASTEWHEH